MWRRMSHWISVSGCVNPDPSSPSCSCTNTDAWCVSWRLNYRNQRLLLNQTSTWQNSITEVPQKFIVVIIFNPVLKLLWCCILLESRQCTSQRLQHPLGKITEKGFGHISSLYFLQPYIKKGNFPVHNWYGDILEKKF